MNVLLELNQKIENNYHSFYEIFNNFIILYFFFWKKFFFFSNSNNNKWQDTIKENLTLLKNTDL
jgi:hypothetical protein